MKTVAIAEATNSLDECVKHAKREPVILTRRGKPVAALVSIRDFDAESWAVSTHPRFMALIERIRERQSREGGLSTGQLRRRLGLTRARRGSARSAGAGRVRGRRYKP